MSAHYTHISEQAERLAMQSMARGRRFAPPPPERPPHASVDLTSPAIQAEIASQVPLARQQMQEGQDAHISQKPEPRGSRLIAFPRGGRVS
jgi:hypothetical protein